MRNHQKNPNGGSDVTDIHRSTPVSGIQDVLMKCVPLENQSSNTRDETQSHKMLFTQPSSNTKIQETGANFLEIASSETRRTNNGLPTQRNVQLSAQWHAGNETRQRRGIGYQSINNIASISQAQVHTQTTSSNPTNWDLNHGLWASGVFFPGETIVDVAKRNQKEICRRGQKW